METDMKKKIRKFLEDNNFLPYSKWNHFELVHGNPDYKKEVEKEIRRNVGTKNGLYIYERNGELLYIGKGKPLFVRIKSHYMESYTNVPGDRTGVWHKFFSLHKGKVRIYWKELEDEKIREIIEEILTYVLNPKFETFKKNIRTRKF